MKKTNEACKILGIHPNTLRHWANEGRIKYVRQPNGNRLYDVDDFLNRGRKIDRAKIIYVRVSSRNQKYDLSSQIRYLRERYPNHELVEDTGSGLSFKRKGFNAILERIMRGDVEEVVVAHRDRLCRFGFDLINSVALYNDCKLVVLDNPLFSPRGEFIEDLVSIIRIFSRKVQEFKQYVCKIKKDTNLSETGKPVKI